MREVRRADTRDGIRWGDEKVIVSVGVFMVRAASEHVPTVANVPCC